MGFYPIINKDHNEIYGKGKSEISSARTIIFSDIIIHVSLSLAPGQKMALVGLTGGGKKSLFIVWLEKANSHMVHAKYLDTYPIYLRGVYCCYAGISAVIVSLNFVSVSYVECHTVCCVSLGREHF